MAATPLNAGTLAPLLKGVSDDAVSKLVHALDRNTAAQLTVAAEIMIGNRPSVSQKDAIEEVLQIFNRLAGQSQSRP
jgi:hypothetical protein